MRVSRVLSLATELTVMSPASGYARSIQRGLGIASIPIESRQTRPFAVSLACAGVDLGMVMQSCHTPLIVAPLVFDEFQQESLAISVAFGLHMAGH